VTLAGAVNRRKSHKGEPGSKDEIAEMVITQLDIQLEQDEVPGVDASTTGVITEFTTGISAGLLGITGPEARA
jgi:hypothetical protein